MKFTGTAIVGQQPRRIWDPMRGWQIVVPYRGIQSQLEAYEATFRALGARTDLSLDPNGGYGSLTVWLGAESTQPADEPLTDRWDLDGQDDDVSIYYCKRIRDAFPSAEAADLADLRSAVEDVIRGEKAASALLAKYSGAQLTAVTDLLKSVSVGIETDPESQYVLRRTLVLAANSTIKPAYTNVGRVYTTALLEAAESIPANIKFNMPDGFWRKRTPKVLQSSWDRWTVTSEWWWQPTLKPMDLEIE